MAILATARYRVRPGSEDRFVELATRQLAQPWTWPDGAHQARLFQHVEDSGDLLFMSEWESREQYLAAMPGNVSVNALTALTAAHPVRHFFQPLRRVEHLGRRMMAGVCGLLEGSPEAAEAIQQALYAQIGTVSEAPGLVLAYAGQELEHPGRYQAVAGWQDAAALQQFMRGGLPARVAEIAQLAVEVDVFVGVARAEGVVFAHGPRS